MREELAEIVAGARAALEDAAARGVWAEDPDAVPVALEPAALPEPVLERAAGAPGPERMSAPPVAETSAMARWSSIAAEARDRPIAPPIALDRVREDLGECRRCGLCKERRTIVFGVGNPSADLAIVGEAPGYHEDQQGEPFVGAAGQMLDRMLENVLGLARAEVYITNVVKCRPPKNRNPLPDEVDACRPFLEAQLRAIQPKVVLLLGSVAFRTLFATDEGITRHRGIWRSYEGLPVLPTFHPAYLLRTPEDKKLAFEDLKVLRARYDALGGARKAGPPLTP